VLGEDDFDLLFDDTIGKNWIDGDYDDNVTQAATWKAGLPMPLTTPDVQNMAIYVGGFAGQTFYMMQRPINSRNL
jgi:hypothetical protein